MRPSLEALGFDLDSTARCLLNSPLQWSTDQQLPEHITLITAQWLPEQTVTNADEADEKDRQQR